MQKVDHHSIGFRMRANDRFMMVLEKGIFRSTFSRRRGLQTCHIYSLPLVNLGRFGDSLLGSSLLLGSRGGLFGSLVIERSEKVRRLKYQI